MVKGKEKFALWITPECKQLVDDCYADDQCQSRSEYIEKAILFYTGFLYAEKADRYLPKVLQQILAGTLDRFAERIGRPNRSRAGRKRGAKRAFRLRQCVEFTACRGSRRGGSHSQKT